VSELYVEGEQHRRNAAMAFSYSLLSRGRDTVRAANRGNASSQNELGYFHFFSAFRLDILQGTPADDDTVAARWAETLRFVEGAAAQGAAGAQERRGLIYATGDRSVPQNWTTAVKWWRKAAEAREMGAQFYIGVCYYYGRGVARDVAQAMAWIGKAAAKGYAEAAVALQTGIPGRQAAREDMARFTNAGSAPVRHEAAHQFPGNVNEYYLISELQQSNNVLQESDSGAPHQSPRDSVWVDFMVGFGLSDEELELAKRVHAYSQRTCTSCGSNSVPLRKCSLCMELRYCIGTDCQHAHWNWTPSAESHKVLCPRIFVRVSKGRMRRV
jgi:TPR repeat protein